MTMDATHIEILLALFGLGGFATRLLWPQFLWIALVFQTLVFLLQIVKVTKTNPKLFLAKVTQHYLETHPEGKHLADNTKVDEKVQAVYDKETEASEPGTIG